jgi:sugar-specific transcriptional regulator TrmB
MDNAEREDLLESLRKVGLNRYEASVYLGLVTDQSAKVAEISRRTGVPQPKVYQALDALVEKGFCSMGSDAINRYRPIEPVVAMSGHLTQLKKEEADARELATRLDVLRLEGEDKELWAPPIEVVKGLKQVSSLLIDRIQSAKHEIWSLCKQPQLRAMGVAEALLDAGERGVELRFVFEEGYLDEPGCEEQSAIYRSQPGDLRTYPELPTKLVMVDRKVAIAAITRAGGDSFLVLSLRHPGLVEHFAASYEHIWEHSKPLA